MAPNILTTITGLNLLPLFCGTVVEHYWNRINALPFPLNSGIVRDIERGGAVSGDNMKREELLYHEVFAIIKVSFVRVGSLDSTGTLVLAGCVLLDHLSVAVLSTDWPLVRTILSHHHRLVPGFIGESFLVSEVFIRPPT